MFFFLHNVGEMQRKTFNCVTTDYGALLSTVVIII